MEIPSQSILTNRAPGVPSRLLEIKLVGGDKLREGKRDSVGA